MGRLLRGENPFGGKCNLKTLAQEAGADRTAFYGKSDAASENVFPRPAPCGILRP
jgi:hypothetical protein